ncbi:MAG: 3',5'-cyclic-AMP phosphodiesterase [Steroidobacterales bacterium]
MNTDIRLLQFSDTHLFASPQGTLRGVQTLASLQRVLAHATARNSRADALLVTGDIVNDEVEGYAHFRRVLATLPMPVYCLPGNHDDPAQLRSAVSGPPFQVGGHADLGRWRLILLDSCVPGQDAGRLGEHELQRLESALAGAADRHVMICLHHHPVDMGSRWLDAVGLENAEDFFAVADRYRQVRAVVWGHVHQCLDQRRKGVRLLATPATCGQFLPSSNEFKIDQRPPGYRRLTLHADGTLDTEVVWVAQAAGANAAPAAAG